MIDVKVDSFITLLGCLAMTVGLNAAAAAQNEKKPKECTEHQKVCWGGNARFCCLKTQDCGNKFEECLKGGHDTGGSAKGRSQDKLPNLRVPQ
jgi:hypothetical protein